MVSRAHFENQQSAIATRRFGTSFSNNLSIKVMSLIAKRCYKLAIGDG
jgi:hypothetical protein